jgi:hypothetical protein
MNDYFPLPDGRQIHPYLIGTAVWAASYDWMHQYQIVQEKNTRVVMRIVTSRNPTDAEFFTLKQAVGDLLGPQVEFAVVLVDDIHDEVNGKFRIYRSLVESEYND